MRTFKITIVRSFGDIVTEIVARSVQSAREMAAKKYETVYQCVIAEEK